jgi:lipid II:glycine glycyltransferase (peptidoglycan interpeptide bridge formation enzyme)
MATLKIIFNQMGAKEWDSLLEKAAFCALQQDWSYGAILRQLGAGVDRAVIYKDDVPLAMVQIIQRKFLKFFDVSTIHRGPVFIGDIVKEDQELIVEKILKEYPRKFKNFCIITPEEDSSVFLKEGRRQIYTGHSTNVLDLTKPEEELWGELSSKNRNKIRKAQKNNLKFTISDYRDDHMNFILGEELKQQKSVGYSGLPPDFTVLYGELSGQKSKVIKEKVITVFAYKDNKTPHDLPIAGAVCLLHGNCATYHIGWNGSEGRKLQAMNHVLWQMIKKLKMMNIKYLDLGGLNTDKAPDIARFKLSFGGKLKSLSGSFL